MVELINNEVLHVCNERNIAISRLFAKHKPREVTDCISVISYNLYNDKDFPNQLDEPPF